MTFEQVQELFFELRVNAEPSGFHGFLVRSSMQRRNALGSAD